jgi:hypothetical protein
MNREYTFGGKIIKTGYGVEIHFNDSENSKRGDWERQLTDLLASMLTDERYKDDKFTRYRVIIELLEE